jgi:hypothetical protein
MDNRNPTYGRFYRGFRGNIGVDTGGMVMVTMHGSLVGGRDKGGRNRGRQGNQWNRDKRGRLGSLR